MNGSCRKNEITTGKKSLERQTMSESEYLENMRMLQEEDGDAPKQVEEPKSLDEHSNERPLDEDE
jgi:hypothetical protein